MLAVTISMTDAVTDISYIFSIDMLYGYNTEYRMQRALILLKLNNFVLPLEWCQSKLLEQNNTLQVEQLRDNIKYMVI